jgi:hypothetical protein
MAVSSQLAVQRRSSPQHATGQPLNKATKTGLMRRMTLVGFGRQSFAP